MRPRTILGVLVLAGALAGFGFAVSTPRSLSLIHI